MHKIKIALRLLLQGDFRTLAKKILESVYLYKHSRESVAIQNRYNLTPIQEADKLLVFLVPGIIKISGGIMTIFQLCKISRSVKPDALTLIATFPGYSTYAKNNTFDNNEQIFRFEQIISHINNIQELVLHIPEYYVERFYTNLSKKEKGILSTITNFRINILNQNINFMPDHSKIINLYKLTSNVTQSSGFLRYTTQEVCDRFHLPLYYIPSFLDLDDCIKKSFDNKEKLILYSPDFHPMKNKILSTIQDNLIGFKLKEIKNLTYNEFLEVVSDAMFCITFGEGFDGYYIQPYYAKSIGITVYNDTFFPKSEIQNFPFVYDDYNTLAENIVNDIDKAYKNKKLYEEISESILKFFVSNINKKEDTINGLRSFYDSNPKFKPSIRSEKKELDDVIIDQKIENEPILTAIIFTYNHRSSIKTCIESLLEQETEYSYKIHIWDDCSIDGTSDICRMYAKKYPDKIVLIVQKENTFLKSYYELQSYAAMQKVTSNYFCIIDGDDYWLDKNKIQLAVDFLEKNSNFIGFAHDTLIVDKFAHTNSSYIHDCLKWNVTNNVTLTPESPFFLTSSRIFRNCGYVQRNLLPIDYLLYYYHLSKGSIYYYDKIMAAYVQGKNSSFISLGLKTRNLNSMFPYRLSLLFDFKQDRFCTDLQKKYDVTNNIGKHRYWLLRFLKGIFGVEYGWTVWFYILFVPRYGLKCADIHYVYCHKKARKQMDNF